ncbi:TrmH family RNA methyltransferase [Mycolicibacterium grossiae]|uniref:RNA methyltransferase n=1 Tax=Mycolicibacterium grossiae TaxID=1552759 RepID=A0A1E8PZ27_9MYCO|nr:RNA methyltransferase [Mycolicibacterium grossiae]OFJ51565.1 RNA methyltransferase [Mycolicibacterium grossiae]QEM46624.1 RNA methyltransferase [Mycolicibacterium grossiae]
MAAAVKLLRPAGRKRAGRFLVEGPNLIEAALRRGLVLEAYATATAADRFADLLAGVDVVVVTDKAARTLSDTVTPVGLVAVCTVPELTLADALAAPSLVAVAVGTSDPGNAGTLIRLADAMGADAFILAGDSVDPYNPKCLRASAGSIFSVPVLAAADPVALIAELVHAELVVMATTLDGETSLDEVNLDVPTAWLFGSEAHGIPADVAAAADVRVRIPMAGGAESLNVAAAAAICLYASSRASR